MITILSTVTFICNEAFHKTSGITMIHVLQEDEKSYGKEAFKASEYGLQSVLQYFRTMRQIIHIKAVKTIHTRTHYPLYIHCIMQI